MYLLQELQIFWQTFHDNLQQMLVLQLQSGPPLDEMSIACILRDLLHAIDYLHSEGKIHRDIKGYLSSSQLNEFVQVNFLFQIIHEDGDNAHS